MRRALVLLLLAMSSTAFAEDGDGLYGRFDATTSVVLGAGAAFDPSSGEAAALVDARVRIVDAVGLATTLRMAPNTRTRGFFGVELRPLFPGMFLKSMSTGHAYLDLFVQSLGVEVGVDSALVAGASLGFVWGFSIEVPLVRPDRFAHGVGLRLGMRHTTWFADARPNGTANHDALTLYAMLAIGFDAGNAVADWEPRRYRDD